MFVFSVADVAIGVALAPRYATAAPDAIYGNNLAQQITSTFDVTISVLSLIVLVVMLFTGPLAGYLVRRAPAPKAVPEPEPPTVVRREQQATVPRIVRRREDPTTVLEAPPTAVLDTPTQTLRIQRRPSKPR